MFTILTLYGSWLRSRDNKPDRSSSSEDPGAVLEQSCSAGIDRSAILALAFAGLAVSAQAQAQTPPESSAKIPPTITTPSTVETRIGTLEFKDGAPTIETAEKLRDTPDFTAARREDLSRAADLHSEIPVNRRSRSRCATTDLISTTNPVLSITSIKSTAATSCLAGARC